MKLGMFLRPCGHHIASWRHPQAKRRGLFRTQYEGSTLRDNLGLKTLISRYARSAAVAAG